MSTSDPSFERPAYARVSRSHKGVDAQVRREERRKRLLEAGLETLGTKGYHQTTVREVCGHAGLSERYFYESFPSLGDLFTTIYQELHETWLKQLMDILNTSQASGRSPLETAETAISTWLAYLKEDPRRARITLVDALGVNDGATRVQAATRDYVGAIQALLERLYPRLADMSMSPRIIASMITGACIMAAKEWAWSNFETPLPTMTAHLMALFASLDGHYKRTP